MALENTNVTLKGLAMLAAIDSGLVPEDPSVDGYNIAPFLRFWELFSPSLEKTLEDAKNVPEVLHQQCESRTGGGTDDV